MHLEIGNASGEASARLAPEVDRRRAEQQKPPGPAPLAATGINQATQYLEEAGKTMDYVKNDEFVFMVRQIEFGLGELRPIGIRFQVEVNRRPGLGDFERQRRLSHLPRSDERDGRRFFQPLRQSIYNRRSIILAMMDVDSIYAMLFFHNHRIRRSNAPPSAALIRFAIR